MDPEACLRRALSALVAGDRDECKSALADYRGWRGKGGFEPPRGDDRAHILSTATDSPDPRALVIYTAEISARHVRDARASIPQILDRNGFRGSRFKEADLTGPAIRRAIASLTERLTEAAGAVERNTAFYLVARDIGRALGANPRELPDALTDMDPDTGSLVSGRD